PLPAHPQTSALSLHDALPIFGLLGDAEWPANAPGSLLREPIRQAPWRECGNDPGRPLEFVCIEQRHPGEFLGANQIPDAVGDERSEEHTSELQSRFDLVCRLL